MASAPVRGKGLKKDSEDYRAIEEMFRAKKYDADRYSPEEIRTSNSVWEEMYSKAAFSTSLKVLVNKVRVELLQDGTCLVCCCFFSSFPCCSDFCILLP
jgi:hypothetical protein